MSDDGIVAAVDLSHASNTVLAQAAVLARQWGCRVWLLHVLDDSAWTAARNVFTPAAWGAAEPVGIARQRLPELAAQIRQREGIDVQHETRLGRVADQIAAFALEVGARLIVLGRHGGDDSAGRPLLGGTALRTVERVATPVLTACEPVRAGYSEAIVAVDFSDNARRAATVAVAWFPEASVTLLHAYSLPLESRMRLAEPSVGSADYYRDQERRLAERRMEELRRDLAPLPARVRAVVRYGHPAATIVEEARQNAADLIVVGRHGGRAVGERLLGSVTQDVLHQADVSVLLVP